MWCLERLTDRRRILGKMKMYYIYVMCFVGLSGLGIVFLNAESILAVCFFIFLGLILQNGEWVGESLEETRKNIKSEFLTEMVKGQRDQGKRNKMEILKKADLLKWIEHLK